jgi:hypothetical protein
MGGYIARRRRKQLIRDGFEEFFLDEKRIEPILTRECIDDRGKENSNLVPLHIKQRCSCIAYAAEILLSSRLTIKELILLDVGVVLSGASVTLFAGNVKVVQTGQRLVPRDTF